MAAHPALGQRGLPERSAQDQPSGQNPSPSQSPSQSQNPPQNQEAPAAAPVPNAPALQTKTGTKPGPADGSIIDPQIIVDARAGNPVAQYKLGYNYYLGHGIAQDYSQAAIWWRKAAEQGYADAQNNLGVLYNSGKGVPQSFSEAYFWQNLAAARSNGPMQAEFAKNRDESAARLSFFERLRVQKRASRWFNDHPAASTKADTNSGHPSSPVETAPATNTSAPSPDQPEAKPAPPHAALA